MQELGTERMLIFGGVEEADEGEYRCQALVLGSVLYTVAPLVVIRSLLPFLLSSPAPTGV